MSEETTTATTELTPEQWMAKKMQEEKSVNTRKNNIAEFLNDPDETKKAMKEKIWNEGLKERIEKNPTIADSKAMLSEAYIMRLENEQALERAREEATRKQNEKTETHTETVKPPAAITTETKTGGFFGTDGKLDKTKVSKTTATMAEMVGIL